MSATATDKKDKEEKVERVDPTLPVPGSYPADTTGGRVRIVQKVAGGLFVDEDGNEYERSMNKALLLKPVGDPEPGVGPEDGEDEAKPKNGRRAKAEGEDA